MDDLRLREALRPLAESISTRTQLESERMFKEGFKDDGTLEENLITRALPWQRADVVIPGAAVAMSGAARVAFPQGGVIRHVSIFARTAPSSAYQITIQAGSESQSFSLQSGQSVSMRPASLTTPVGIWAHINVTNAGGAADVTVVLHYVAVGASSGSSGGGSGGSGGGGASAVLSVNGQTGTVLLNADHIDDTSTSHKFATAAQLTKLNDIDLSNYVLASSLALVATSGSYADLANKPTLGTAAAMNANAFATATQGGKADSAVQPADLADVATSGDYADLNDKPTIPAQFNPIAGTNVSITGTYPDITFSASGGGGGGGAVDSVNGQTGIVVLDADDIDDSSTSHKFATAAQLTKLNGIEAGAEVNVQSDWDATSGDAAILNKPSTFPPSTHSHSWTSITGKPTTFPPAPHNHDERYYTQAEVDAMIAERHVSTDLVGNPNSTPTTYVGATYADAAVLQSTTLGSLIPEITSGIWDVLVQGYATLYRDVATGGAYFFIGAGGYSQLSLVRGFTMTGAFTMNRNYKFTGLSAPDVIDLRFSGFSTAGTTYCVSYGATITATRTG